MHTSMVATEPCASVGRAIGHTTSIILTEEEIVAAQKRKA
jgi:hypothetical protein